MLLQVNEIFPINVQLTIEFCLKVEKSPYQPNKDLLDLCVSYQTSVLSP